jgi:hypothetical protein
MAGQCPCKPALEPGLTCAPIVSSTGNLMLLMHAGKLPGKAYGRICDCAMSMNPKLTAVINTALSSTASLGTTLIVSNRATAMAVLEHLKITRAGCMKCLIVEEAAPANAHPLPAAFERAAAGSLDSHLQAMLGCEDALAVVQGLLAGWVHVPDWQAAEACSASQKGSHRRLGIITSCASAMMPLVVIERTCHLE